MENDKLNEMCQKILGKTLDEALGEIGMDDLALEPIEVMTFKITSLPGQLMVEGTSSKIFGQTFNCEKELNEALKRCSDVFQEEAIKITEKLGGVKGFKKFTNMKE